MNTSEVLRIVRAALRQYETGGNGTQQAPIVEMEILVDDIVGQIRVLIDSLAVPYRLWNSGGVDALVMAAGSATDAPEGSQYTQQWWYQAQSVFNAFKIWYSLPLSTLAALSAEVDGETVQPFAFLSAVPVDGDLTPLKIISTNPEVASE